MTTIDLHTHSNISDGTDSPSQLVIKAAQQGLDVVALCDHDTFDGLVEANDCAMNMGIELVAGLEMSCKASDGTSAHLLGYGCDVTNEILCLELAKIRGGRSGRVAAMVRQLTAADREITVAEVMAQAGTASSIGRPHIADVMVKRGYVSDRKEAFDHWLGEGMPGYVERYTCSLSRAISLIQQAGGVAVLAHPWGRGSRNTFTYDYLEQLISDEKLDGIEVDHQDHDSAARMALGKFLQQYEVLKTGSSDYHGLGKVNHELACNTTSPEMLLRLKELLANRTSS
ncbi:MAG: PHP domain-containing protein [Propionibacteriaceae bacterium]